MNKLTTVNFIVKTPTDALKLKKAMTTPLKAQGGKSLLEISKPAGYFVSNSKPPIAAIAVPKENAPFLRNALSKLGFIGKK